MPHEVALHAGDVVVQADLLDEPEEEVADRLELVVERRPEAERRLAARAAEQPLGMPALEVAGVVALAR